MALRLSDESAALDATAYSEALLGVLRYVQGGPDEARALIAGVRGDSFAAIPRGYNGMGTTAMLARGVAVVGDATWSREPYDLLVPHGPVIA